MAFVSDPDFTLYVGDALDVLRELEASSVHCCVTSPPYLGLRDYGHDDQIGLEPTIGAYVAKLVEVFAEVRRVLRDDGTLWLNLGDSYNAYNGGAGPSSALSQTQSAARPRFSSGFGLQQKELKPKDMMGIPWRVAFALQADGWYLRSDIIWSKPNPMPESVTDRPTKAHEYLFLLTKSARYFYDADAIREPAEWARWGDQTVGAGSNPNGWIKPKTKQELTGEARPGARGDTYSGFNERYFATHRKSDAEGANGRNVQELGSEAERRDEVGGSFNNNPRLRANVGRNRRSVWEIATEPYPDAHFATFPQALVEPCVKAGCPEGGTVLDPFMGSGTTALVARRLGRKSVGIELNQEYAVMCARRLGQQSLLVRPVA